MPINLNLISRATEDKDDEGDKEGGREIRGVSARSEAGRTPSAAEVADKERSDVIISISRSDCGGTPWHSWREWHRRC